MLMYFNREYFVEFRDKPQQIHESFHEAFGPVLLVGQFFGLIPCDNVLQSDEKKIQFRWKSPKTIYSLIFLFFGSIECAVGIRRFIRLGFNIHFVESLIFFLSAMIKAMLMFQLGRKWPSIMEKWRNCENVFLQSPYESNGWKLKKKLRFVAFIFISFVLSKQGKLIKVQAKIY